MAVGGRVAWAITMITCLPIWANGLGHILWQLIKSPKRFFRRVDRSFMKFADPFPGLEHEYTEINGVRLHIVVGGRSTGAKRQPLMLFVHGFPEIWYSWRHQMKAFMDDYVVVAYDGRGFGQSEIPKGRQSFAYSKLVGDVVGIVHHFGYEKCVLVGHDWGGGITWQTTMYHPEVVERLVSLATAHPDLYRRNMDAEQTRMSKYIWYWQAPLLPELQLSADDFDEIEGYFRRPPKGVRNPGAVTDNDMERYKQAIGRPGCLHAGLNYYRAVIDGVTWAAPMFIWKPRRVECPTLVVAADGDYWLSVGLLRGMEEVVAAPEVHVVKDCSHWVQQEKPEEVNQLMRDFLSK